MNNVAQYLKNKSENHIAFSNALFEPVITIILQLDKKSPSHSLCKFNSAHNGDFHKKKFLLTQLKRNWQCLHCYVAKSLL